MSKQERDQQRRPPAGQSPPVTRAPPSAGRRQSRLPADTHAKQMNLRPSMEEREMNYSGNKYKYALDPKVTMRFESFSLT